MCVTLASYKRASGPLPLTSSFDKLSLGHHLLLLLASLSQKQNRLAGVSLRRPPRSRLHHWLRLPQVPTSVEQSSQPLLLLGLFCCSLTTRYREIPHQGRGVRANVTLFTASLTKHNMCLIVSLHVLYIGGVECLGAGPGTSIYRLAST